jgi:hypothetical protein
MAGNRNPDLSSDDLDSANASESSANSTKIRCRLIELPVEIRLIIYGFVFGDRTLHIGWEKGANDPSRNAWGWTYSVCSADSLKTIRQERGWRRAMPAGHFNSKSHSKASDRIWSRDLGLVVEKGMD